MEFALAEATGSGGFSCDAVTSSSNPPNSAQGYSPYQSGTNTCTGTTDQMGGGCGGSDGAVRRLCCCSSKATCLLPCTTDVECDGLGSMYFCLLLLMMIFVGVVMVVICYLCLLTLADPILETLHVPQHAQTATLPQAFARQEMA